MHDLEINALSILAVNSGVVYPTTNAWQAKKKLSPNQGCSVYVTNCQTQTAVLWLYVFRVFVILIVLWRTYKVHLLT